MSQLETHDVVDDENYEIGEKNTAHRAPKRVVHGKNLVHSILREGFVCHVGFDVAGYPAVVPSTYGFKNETIYLHSHPSARLHAAAAKAGKVGVPVCVTVTHVDGLWMGPTPLMHAVNYRSVVVYANAKAVTDREEKVAALKILLDHAIPGREVEFDNDFALKFPSEDDDVKKTGVVAISLVAEGSWVSAKTSNHDPVTPGSGLLKCPVVGDPEADPPHWQGLIPIRQVYGPPVRESDVDIPDYVVNYRRPKN